MRTETSREEITGTTTVCTSANVVSLTGHTPEAVLNVIRGRMLRGSRDDGHRLALVVEGGSMRGVYTAASLLALHIMGLSQLFDNAYGTSAGAVNTAHFLSGLGHLKVDSYYRVLSDGRFFNPRRLWKIVDVDFFINKVLKSLRPLEIERVMKSPTPLWVSVGDFVTGRIVSFHAQEGRFPILEILRAAAAMPIVYNRLVPLGDVRGFDAGSVNPFPLDEALTHKNTHILVLSAKPQQFLSVPWKWYERFLFRRFFSRGNTRINELYESAGSNCDRLRDLAHGRLAPPDNVSIATIAPVSQMVGRNTQDIDLLRSELIETTRATLRLFDYSEHQLDELVRSGTI